jgi:hypothetical protein
LQGEKTTVIWFTRLEVDKSLEIPEAGFRGVLILVWLWLVLKNIGTIMNPMLTISNDIIKSGVW